MKGQMIAAAGGWDAMKGEKICAKPGTPQVPAHESAAACLPSTADPARARRSLLPTSLTRACPARPALPSVRSNGPERRCRAWRRSTGL